MTDEDSKPQLDEELDETLAGSIEQEATSELATDEQTEEKPPEGYIAADQHQKEVNKQHWKYREEQRAREQAEARAKEIEQELAEIKAQKVDLTVPQIPDPYDEEFEAKIRERDEAIQRLAQHKTQQAQLEAEQREAQEQTKRDQLAETQKKVRAFEENAVDSGLQPTMVQQAAEKVVAYGVTELVEDVILRDKDGPLLVAYLAENPLELDRLNSMSPYDFIADNGQALSTIKAKAQTLRPQTSQAPDPPKILRGGGVPESEDEALKGVIFE